MSVNAFSGFVVEIHAPGDVKKNKCTKSIERQKRRSAQQLRNTVCSESKGLCMRKVSMFFFENHLL